MEASILCAALVSTYLFKFSHMIKIEVVVDVWPQHANFIILYFYTVLLATSCLLSVTYYNTNFNYM